MHIRSFPSLTALPRVLMAPGSEGGTFEAEDDPYAEQPGDREPDEKATPEPEAKPEPESEEGDADEEAETEGEAESSVEAEAEADPEDEEEEAPKAKPDWRARQVQKERQKRQEAEKAAKEANDRAAALEALYAKPESERTEGETTLTREQAREEALKIVRQEQYVADLNRKADSLFEAGQKTFPKTWGARTAEAAEALREEIVARPDFLEAVADLDNGAAVYHELAGDLDRFKSILKLPAHKMGMELARISAKVATPVTRQVSKAPAPIVPLEKPTKGELPIDDPNISMEEFDRRMTAMEKKRWEAKHA